MSQSSSGSPRINSRILLFALSFLIAVPLLAAPKAPATASQSKPAELRCDSLINPIGLDAKQPRLSWKLRDSRTGAKQTAYQILVASSPRLLAAGKADVWDSGRSESDQSTGVLYAGPALTAEKRYYWQVRVWDKDNKPYPLSDASWWETGLLDEEKWHGKWIGYEDSEHHSVREAAATWITNPAVPDYKGNRETRHDFRLAVDLSKTVKTAVLYVTGEDTISSWINGQQILQARPQPAWGRNPWRTYTRKVVTSELHTGKNLLAVEVVAYKQENHSQTPMNAALYLEMADGTIQVLKTGSSDWKAQFEAKGDWYLPAYDDTSWPQAIACAPTVDAFGGSEKLGNPLQTGPVAALRHSFQVVNPVVSARLYVTALGSYKFSMNGKPVGDQILSPGWTDFRERVTYQVFDVTSILRQGKNAVGVYLAPGWYTTPLEWVGQGNNYGDTQTALKAQLRIEHKNGSVQWVATDESWKAETSPIEFAEIYDGETYDARRFHAGWDTASFSDQNWNPAQVVQPREPEIVWQSFQPIRSEQQLLTAKKVTSPKPGVYIYDFGQNLAGLARIHVQGSAGTDVRLRFAEILNDDGTIYTDNLRNAKATDHYILSGKGIEEYQPTFTFHGFRYVEVSGLPADPGLAAVKAVVLHTDAPFTAQFKTGSPMVNQLWNNILWGQRSNFVGVPTDCPQRDERLGWSADAQVFWRTATFNMDLAAFSRKYARDLRGTQYDTPMYGIYAPGTSKPNPGYATGWSDAGVIVPWTSWIQNGDTQIIEQNWDGMEKYLAAIQAVNPDDLWKNKSGTAFGDWLSPEGATPQELIATAYWAYDVELMAQMAHAIGKNDDGQRYAELFEKIKAAFNHAYVHSDGYVGAPPASGKEPIETQTGYVLALHMNLLPESLRPIAAKRLVDRIAANGGKLATGFLGTPYLLEVLSDTGHADVAYQLLLNTKYPSWGYMIEHGATTMWERWNGDTMRDPGMNSYNHYAYGAVAEWLYRYAAGIDTVTEDAGFHTIYLHPNFDTRLGSLNFSYDSPYGTVQSAWTANAGEVTWKVTIPPNTKARLPLSSAKAQSFTIDGLPLAQSSALHVVATQDNQETYELPAGTYSFKVKSAQP